MSDREAQVVITANNTQYNKSIEESQKATDKLVKSLEKTSETFTKINKATAKGLFKIGAAEIAGLTALSAIAATLEKQTSNIQSNLALNKASSQYNEVTSSIRELSRAIPMARAEIAQMATEVSNLGFVSGSQISKVTAQFSKMGVATGEAPTALAQNMVQFQRAMGMAPTAQTMLPYQQSTTLLSARAGVPANDILSFAGNIAPAGRVAGLNQSTVLGLATAATRSGADGTYASSTINQILNDITMLRYSRSPEIKRYSNALGIPMSELTGNVTNTDAFNRNIINKILQVSQSEEGPTRLGMLGFEGLRAKKALQMMASESGGVESWINMAEAGMGSKSIETGFEAATSGLADEMTMLRNKFTDLGQTVGEPTAMAFTKLASSANWAADKVNDVVQPFAKLAGWLTGPLATAMMGVAGILTAWKGISTYSLLKRGTYNVGTSALISGIRQGQDLVAGGDPNAPINRMAANVMSGDKMRASGFQRVLFGVGEAIGTAAPDMRARSPLQKTLEGVNRLNNWIAQGTRDWYRRTGMASPEDRYADRMQQQEAQREYTNAVRERAAQLKRLAQMGITEEVAIQKRLNLTEIPERPKGMFVPKERYTVSGTLRDVALTPAKTALAAAGMAVLEPWRMREPLGRLGGAIKTDLFGAIQEDGTRTRGRLSGLRGLISPDMLLMAGATYGLKTWQNASEETSRWDEAGKGFNGEILNTLRLYNEKLGLATSALERFAGAVDEANPAKTDDIKKELNDKVFQRGSDPDYKLIDERIRIWGKDEATAKKFLSSQDTALNADQAVTVFQDLAAIMSKTDWTKLKDWYVTSTVNGKPSNDMLLTGFNETAKTLAQATQDSMSSWKKAFAWFAPIAEGGSFDPLSLRNDEKLGQISADYVSMVQQIGEYYRDNYNASGVVKGDLDQTKKEEALSLGVKFSKAYEALAAVTDQFAQSGTPAARAAWFNVKNRTGEILDINLEGINIEQNSNAEDVKRALWDRMLAQVTEQANSGNDPALAAALASGLITKDINSILKDLPVKPVTTSVDTMLEGSKFSGMSQADKNKWFGETSVLKDIGVGINDPIKQVAASFKMLKMAQETFGNSIAETDYALQSFKTNLSTTSPQYGIIQGAQQLLNLKEGQFFNVGASPADKTASLKERTTQAIASAQGETNPADSQERLISLVQENADVITSAFIKTESAAKQYRRSSEDFNKSMAWQKEDFDRQIEHSDEDFYRNRKNSIAAFHRQMAQSEAAFHRSMKYQQEDFYRSRLREEETYQRQRKYAAQDTAKAIGDPYNRVQLQLLSDPSALAFNMENRARLADLHNANIDKLKGMGLSEAAMQQLNVADFNNSQQVDYMTKTMTPEMVDRFNKVADRLVAAGGELNKEDTGTKRAEEERAIALAQSLEDFIRGLKRSKIEHEIQVKFSKKEFEIGLKISEKEHEISLDRAREAFDRSQERAQYSFDKSLERQKEDIQDFMETYAKTQEEMVAAVGKNLKSMGLSAENTVNSAVTSASKNLQALWKTIESLGEVKIKIETRPSKEWDTKNTPEKTETAREDRRGGGPDPKAGWGKHPVLGANSGGEIKVWYEKEQKYISYSRWRNIFPGAKLAAGGILPPKSGGHMATIAEGGSAEAVIPLNARGIDFMTQFTKGVAAYMVKTMPKTPVSPQHIVNNYDHSQNVRIDGMVVESNDPRKFLKELKKEAQKKNAALYKS